KSLCAEVDPRRGAKDGRERADGEDPIDVAGEGNALQGAPRRPDRVDDQDSRGERGAPQGDPFRLEGGEGVRAGERRVLPGELERETHRRPPWDAPPSR